MNTLLPPTYVEVFDRLLLGLQVIDASRAQRLSHAVEMRVEPKPWVDPLTDDQQRWLRARIDARMPLSDGWERVPRHASGRHVLRYVAGRGIKVDIRVLDSRERIVPRRLRIPLVSLGVPENVSVLDALPVGQRSRTPSLYPGAAYDISERVTGLRGRVVVSDQGVPPKRVPVRWPRIEARLPAGGPLVAWAHGDQHGEFLLVLPPEAIASPAVQMPRPLSLDVIAHGRRGLPAAPPPVLVRRADPFWDLPLEVLGAPGRPAGQRCGRARPDDSGRLRRLVRTVGDVHVLADRQQRHFAVRYHLGHGPVCITRWNSSYTDCSRSLPQSGRERAARSDHMPEYLAPGVYVEEVSFRSKSIEGVPTSTTGFAGMTRYGPVHYPGGPSSTEPRLITSFTEFERDVRRARGAAHADRRRRTPAVSRRTPRASSS